MIFTASEVASIANSTQRRVGDLWVIARPIGAPFGVRLKSALMVLFGRADAVVWPAGQ